MLLGFDMYLRPGELLDVRGSDVFQGCAVAGHGLEKVTVLIRPWERGRPTKTAVFDESIELDGLTWKWLVPAVVTRSRERGVRPIIELSMRQLNAQMKSALKKIGLERWRSSPHTLRHSGPSSDSLAQRRCLDDIRRRGRWRTIESLRRYEKGARLGSRLQELDADQLRFVLWCSANLENIMLKNMAVHVPPGIVKSAGLLSRSSLAKRRSRVR
jgi:integrase